MELLEILKPLNSRLYSFGDTSKPMIEISEIFDFKTNYRTIDIPKVIYIIILKNEVIPYPKADNPIIYIGETSKNLNKRLKEHYTTKEFSSKNEGIWNYVESNRCDFIYLIPDKKEYDMDGYPENWTFERNVEDDLLDAFQNALGCIPICNGKGSSEKKRKTEYPSREKS